MQEADKIIEAIDGIANFYGGWAIGVTGDPTRRRSQLGSPRFWYAWNAQNQDEAKSITRLFLEKGMQATEEDESDATHVFVFLRRPSSLFERFGSPSPD